MIDQVYRQKNEIILLKKVGYRKRWKDNHGLSGGVDRKVNYKNTQKCIITKIVAQMSK